MNKNLIIYGYNRRNLGDDLMFAEIINKTDYHKYYFLGDSITPALVTKKIKFIKQGRLMAFRWKWKSDFAIIGGSVLMGATKAQESMILQKIDWFKMNKLFGGRNFIIGANLGPFESRTYYLSLLSALNKYTDKWFVRDTFSKDLLSELKTKFLKIMPDIVIGLNTTDYAHKKSTNSVAISITQVDKDGDVAICAESYKKEIQLLVQKFISQGKTINFVSFEDVKDLPIITNVISALGVEFGDKVNIIKNEGYNVISTISKSDLVISTRFHSMVLAALFEKPQIIYSYSDKTKQFADNYEFNTYRVTGEIEGKIPVSTNFPKEAFSEVAEYANWVKQ
ncbi:polysaccharide pyruvyl transferase family protein [Glaciecola sp. SC05]|uniref:polysaccharide pyruvyl transferase family protein n=1 Tax=Glaciecola sp. SC05 TaxID=1987355 RepID=UPI003527036A